ncbi:uncharacterized protein EI97DRAFT_470226 [Westerdykella ornata]|uniref:PQ loop repeat protein n=1 Tax=Westerdykella ornata TaxID=318751 RepID=A0A6A6J911_WESOR|nr:uncharacterized protein EI97DRAFT_470226 [Westerdykella ornata]KAF2272663.1 hypothetical protein EI97DRAFT_470226 [Westerdykella ornata]
MGFLNAAVTHIAPIFIATSPITSYADQIYSIHRARTSAGFSLDIPLIMLVSSILKVFYWFGAHYSTSLLLQSLLMITVHLLLLHIALTHRPPLPHPSTTPFAHTTAPARRPYDFWQWRSTRPYWTFLSYFALTLLVLHILISPSSEPVFKAYANLLGYIALAIEATLPIPQLLANYRRRGCKGFRLSVVVNWILGDTFKMWFFFASGSGEGGVPLAFKICGVFQALCDLGLGMQFWIWGDGPGEVVGVVGRAGFAGADAYAREKAVLSPVVEEGDFVGLGRELGHGLGLAREYEMGILKSGAELGEKGYAVDVRHGAL